VVIAVPGPLTVGLGFWPALPPEKVIALSELTYGTAAKVIVQYAEREAVSAAVGAGCFTDGTPPWLVEQSIHQSGDAACVSSLLGGDAEPGVIDEEVFAAFDRSVATLVGRDVTRTGQLAHSWTGDELTRVIVRAPLGDQRTRVLPQVQRPLGDRVFFAGEHTDDRVGPGGLEGATRSALRVAAEMD
jgi:monoamine oxidase